MHPRSPPRSLVRDELSPHEPLRLDHARSETLWLGWPPHQRDEGGREPRVNWIAEQTRKLQLQWQHLVPPRKSCSKAPEPGPMTPHDGSKSVVAVQAPNCGAE